jgi:ankyrin repeat protein
MRGANAAQALLRSVRGGSLDDVRVHLRGILVDNLDSCDELEGNALHLAVWRNHQEVIEALLEAGASTNVQVRFELRILHVQERATFDCLPAQVRWRCLPSRASD